MAKKTFKIAIDGPCGVGKSSTAIELAKQLNFTRVDSGMLYRAMTYTVLSMKNNFQQEELPDHILSPDEISNYKEYITRLKIVDRKSEDPRFSVVVVDSENRSKSSFCITENQLKTRLIEKNVSVLAQLPFVRKKVGELQREIIDTSFPGVIVDGRDIGTVVMPDADIKFFLTASEDIRAKRRYSENLQKSNHGTKLSLDYDQILHDIKERDHNDINRKCGPLKKAEDAILVDNSNLTLSEQVNILIEKILTVHDKNK